MYLLLLGGVPVDALNDAHADHLSNNALCLLLVGCGYSLPQHLGSLTIPEQTEVHFIALILALKQRLLELVLWVDCEGRMFGTHRHDDPLDI